MKQIVLTEDEANEILGTLTDLPIRYLSIVVLVQKFLARKFAEAEQKEKPCPTP